MRLNKYLPYYSWTRLRYIQIHIKYEKLDKIVDVGNKNGNSVSFFSKMHHKEAWEHNNTVFPFIFPTIKFILDILRSSKHLIQLRPIQMVNLLITCKFLIIKPVQDQLIERVSIHKTFDYQIPLTISLILWKKVGRHGIGIDTICIHDIEVRNFDVLMALTFFNMFVIRFIGSWSTSSSPVRSPSPCHLERNEHYGTTSLQQRSRSPSPSKSKQNIFRGGAKFRNIAKNLIVHLNIWFDENEHETPIRQSYKRNKIKKSTEMKHEKPSL